MKSFPIVASLALVAAFAPRVAFAGCPEAGGCNAVVELSASLQGAPACFRIDATETDNGCVCYGDVRLVNDCDFEVVLPDDSQTIAAHGGGVLVVGASDGAPGTQHEEHALVGDGQAFTLTVDYTEAYREMPGACSMSPRSGGGLAGLGLGLAVAALALARRRSR
jgi:hypothetical protein